MQVFYRKWKPHILHAKTKCSDCNGKILYFCRYDADFCPQCDKWITKNCGDPNCPYCMDRPETPKDALAICEMLRAEERTGLNKAKEYAIRRYAANEKHRKRKVFTLL